LIEQRQSFCARGLRAALFVFAIGTATPGSLAAAGSGDMTSSSAGERVHVFKVASARDTWRLNALQDYRFDITLSCYCAAHGRFIVTVAGGRIRDAQRAGGTNNNTETSLNPGDLQTVDQLFEMIDGYLVSRPDAVELRLDRRYGYPAFFRVDPRYGIADDEMTITIHDLAPLPPG
jgi:hypothetical protein